MTEGLLISRNRKNELHKKTISCPEDGNLNLYKSYRNVYNNLIRISKKRFYEDSLKKAIKNPKKLGRS